MNEIEALAKEIAADNGRAWSDMGAYERNDYVFEAECRLDGDVPRNMDEPQDGVMFHAETPFASNH